MAEHHPPHDVALLTPKEAAHQLRVSYWTVLKLMDDGRLRGVYQGSRRYVPSDAIGEYVASLSSLPEQSA